MILPGLTILQSNHINVCTFWRVWGNLVCQDKCSATSTGVRSRVSITVWFGCCTVQDRKALQRVVRSAQVITGTAFPALDSLYQTRIVNRAISIIKHISHPQHRLLTLLPSGRRYWSVKARTTRLKNSFYPQAINLQPNSTGIFAMFTDYMNYTHYMNVYTVHLHILYKYCIYYMPMFYIA